MPCTGRHCLRVCALEAGYFIKTRIFSYHDKLYVLEPLNNHENKDVWYAGWHSQCNQYTPNILVKYFTFLFCLYLQCMFMLYKSVKKVEMQIEWMVNTS